MPVLATKSDRPTTFTNKYNKHNSRGVKLAFFLQSTSTGWHSSNDADKLLNQPIIDKQPKINPEILQFNITRAHRRFLNSNDDSKLIHDYPKIPNDESDFVAAAENFTKNCQKKKPAQRTSETESPKISSKKNISV